MIETIQFLCDSKVEKQFNAFKSVTSAKMMLPKLPKLCWYKLEILNEFIATLSGLQ